MSGTERIPHHTRVPLLVFSTIVVAGAPGQLWFSGPVVDDLGQPVLGADVAARLERDGAVILEGATRSQVQAERSSWALFDGSQVVPRAGRHEVTLTRLEGTALPWDGATPPHEVVLSETHVAGVTLRAIGAVDVEAEVTLGEWGGTVPGTTVYVALDLVQAGRSVGGATLPTDPAGVARFRAPVASATTIEARVTQVVVMIDSSRARALPYWDGQAAVGSLTR